MLLACLALIVGPDRPPVETWTSFAEVYSLAKWDDRLYAGTSGGVLVYEPETKEWVVPRQSLPNPVYELSIKDGRLRAAGPYGAFELRSGWKPVDAPATSLAEAPDLAAHSRLARVDADTGHVVLRATGRDLGQPGNGSIYALFDAQRGLIAGTSQGVWVHSGKEWTCDRVPSTAPMPRLHGLASAGRRGWIAGGLGGLAVGSPGEWVAIDDRPVRKVVARDREIWVVFGDGTVDKLEPDSDRWQHDVLYGAVKRPWASTITVDGEGLLIGGQAGWIEKSSRAQREIRPEWFAGDVVTAITRWKGRLVVAGQKTGLHILNGAKWTHFNAAHGLNDLWITAILEHEGRLFFATATDGLYSTDGHKIRSEDCPDRNLTQLASAGGLLTVGSMRGAFQRTSGRWSPLGPPAETTGLVVDGRNLWVLTPYCAVRCR